MALIIEEIWKARNLKLVQHYQPILSKAKMNVNAKFHELSKVYSLLIHPNLATTDPPTWIPPPTDHIKSNVVAALDSSKSALAVVAWNYKGDVLFIWGKVHHLCPPLQAEASALLWAVQLVTQQHWRSVIFERDAKTHFDALNHPERASNWILDTLNSNIRNLSSFFRLVPFAGLRNSNSAAHEAARFALKSSHPFCFSNGNLPPSIESICKGDVASCFSL
ncbi:uncharacterized protein LOC142628563 [Castanea sativa]|uniref:uncharacterized protein LOC142628563 n=1 Tax=Castanea sativa TaxID=21020 RepID=UPI003F64F09A